MALGDVVVCPGLSTDEGIEGVARTAPGPVHIPGAGGGCVLRSLRRRRSGTGLCSGASGRSKLAL